MNKKNKAIKVNGGFNVQEKRGFVSYCAPYNGGMVYDVARVSADDKFDEELGKAIAFARVELAIRFDEERKALRVVKDMQAHLKAEMKKSPDEDASRFWSRHIATASDYHKELLRYLRNQKKVVALVESGEYTGHKYNEMLKLAHDRVLLEEAKAKERKEAIAKAEKAKKAAKEEPNVENANLGDLSVLAELRDSMVADGESGKKESTAPLGE